MEVEEVVCLPRLSRVAVCGGTHGNELSGVYLVRELLKAEKEVMEKEEEEEEEHPSVSMVLSNPRAVQQCRRYVDTDLNRCFTRADLKWGEVMLLVVTVVMTMSRLFLSRVPAVPRQAPSPTRWSDPGNWTPSWVPKGDLGRWISCATSTTPLPTWACASSRTLTATGSACTYSDTCRQAQNVPENSSAIHSRRMFGELYTNVGSKELRSGNPRDLKSRVISRFQRQMPDIPMRYIHFELSKKESYSLDSVGKHGFGEFFFLIFTIRRVYLTLLLP